MPRAIAKGKDKMFQPDPTIPAAAAAVPVFADCAILRDIETYWQSLRHAQAIPARVDVAAHRIDAALPHAFILQRVAPYVARFRVAGQKLHDLMKLDPRGMPISALFGQDNRAELQALIEAAFVRPAIVAVPLVAPAQLFRGPVTARMLLMPLRDARGQTSRVLGALVADGVVGHRPRRFDLAPDAAAQVLPLDTSAAKATGLGVARPALRLVVNNR